MNDESVRRRPVRTGPGYRRRRIRAALATACAVFVGVSWGCALAPPMVRPGTAERADRAMRALQREAYRPAREDLLALVADCRSGEYGRRALLLLAAAELDTGNPEASPREAARLASVYLRLPDAAPEELPLARALYRIGTDLASPAGNRTAAVRPLVVAPRFDTCDPAASARADRPLPTTPSPRAARLSALEHRLAAREVQLAIREQDLTALEARLAAQSDSLDALEGALRSRAARIAQLNAEIDRIMELLKSGLPGYATHEGR